MNMIACVSNNMCIGVNNDLLVHIKDDMRNFAFLTKRKIVVMGRNTYLSLPDKKPLKDRDNIIISKSMKEAPEGFKLYDCPQSFLATVKDYEGDNVFIIGGAQIYKEFLPVVDTIYLTWVCANNVDLHMADPNFNIHDKYTFFPDEIYNYDWSVIKNGEGICFVKNYGLVKYYFLTLYKQ